MRELEPSLGRFAFLTRWHSLHLPCGVCNGPFISPDSNHSSRNSTFSKQHFSPRDDQHGVKPGTHHAIFVVCWTQRRRKDDCCMVCAHQRQLSPVDFTNATVVGPIRKTNRSNNCCMVCAGQRHMSHQPTGHRPITVKHFRDA